MSRVTCFRVQRLFKNDKLVVWEYVSNSIQYVDIGVSPVVQVTLDSKRKAITISDNGRGMDWAGLQNFFVMHGENQDRKTGRPGRGRFGTGKCAAFGIADVLRITTIRAGLRSKVELRREEINKIGSDVPIPVHTLEKQIRTSEPNGTIVEIEQSHLRALDAAAVIAYVQRHLARCPKGVSVFVNGHECEYMEPPVSVMRRIHPDGQAHETIGNVELVLKVSKTPMDEDLRGVSIFSNGVWHQTTLAGSEGREMAQYIFGEIDVPTLDDDESPIPPFDISRSMTLNPSNNLVRTLFAFINREVEKLRRELVDQDRRRKATEEAKRLQKEAEAIASVINQDFDDFRSRVARAKAKGSFGRDAGHVAVDGADEANEVKAGNELPGREERPTGAPGSSNGAGAGGKARARDWTNNRTCRGECT